jgi:hypothetical protein
MGFFCQIPDGRVLLRHELTWIKTAPEDAARDILDAMARWHIRKLTHVAANPDLWPKDGDDSNTTVSATFIAAGVPMRQGSDDTVNGWSLVRSWLAPRIWLDENGKEFRAPSLIVHPDCKHFVRTFPTLVSDDKHPDEIADSTDQYPAEGLRYYAMSRPVPWKKPEPAKPGPGTVGFDIHQKVFAGLTKNMRILGR